MAWSLKQTSDDQCNVVLSNSLDHNTDSTVEMTDPDRELASIKIRHLGGHRVADRATQGLYGGDKLEPNPRGTVHELPLLK
jgi:hypothetical protein